MAAAVVLMVVALLCFIRTWSKTDELCDSLYKSADSYKIVVADGKELFENSHNTIPTHIDTLKTISWHLGDFIDACIKTSNFFGEMQIQENKYKWFRWIIDPFNRSMEKLKDFAEIPIPTAKQIKDSLDAFANTLNDIKSEEKRRNLCQAFDKTTKSLDHANSTICEINSSLRSIMVIVLISVGVCCSSMFCHGATRWRAITKQA